MPLHHQRKTKSQKKRNIKSRKIDKRKRKILVSKHIITTMVIYYRKCGYYGIQDFVKIEEDITAMENSFENSWI